MSGKYPMLIMGMGDKECVNRLDKLTKWITSSKKRYASVDRVDQWIGDMEKTYISYRRANPKYGDQLDEKKGMSHGVREHYRFCLKKIVLNNNVQNDNKRTAIKLMLSDRANKELYDLLRAKHANGKNGNDNKKEKKLMLDESLIKLILKFFPEHCDQDLMNISSYFAMHAYNDLAVMAIRKIESPRTLLAVCTSFRDDLNTLKCAEVAIECLGAKIEHSCNVIDVYNAEQSESEKIIAYDNSERYQPTNRASWQHDDPDIDHELSMIFSAHAALSNVVVEYANALDGRLTPEFKDHERQIYKNALKKIRIPGFIERVLPRISNVDSEKVENCLIRLSELGGGNAAKQSIISNTNLPHGTICQAIKDIDLDKPENSQIKATLRNYITNKTLNPSIRKAACEKINVKHDYQPNRDGNNKPTYRVCSQCGATAELERPGPM